MSEQVTPERKMHRERLEAIRDWYLPKYSTGVHVTRDETVQMASRVLVAEAVASEQHHAASQFAEAVVRLEAKVAEQAATIERLTKLLREVADCAGCEQCFRSVNAATSDQVQP